jgi:hypothetical protein
MKRMIVNVMIVSMLWSFSVTYSIEYLFVLSYFVLLSGEGII